MTRLWDKGLPLSERVLRYTAGEDHLLDARLVPYDVRGSIAHAEMLAATGLISDEDCNAIRGGLKQLEGSFEAGDWSITLQDEDVHTALESRLTRAIGDAGARLHLGRSRNDQVLTALRLYLLEAADDLVTRIDALRKSVAKLTERQGDIPLPGYTHMQQAMPSSVTLWCGGFDEAFADARDGIGAAKRRMDKNPLGSAAGYGTPGLPLDREMTTASLGFAATQTPVTAAQLSRGKAESGLLFEITLLLQDVGRMAADLLIFYMQEFGYVALAADVTTGSSIMPQKRNPDVLPSCRPVTTATCSASRARCFAASISPSTASTSWHTYSTASHSFPATSSLTRASMRPRRPTGSSGRKASRSATRTARSQSGMPGAEGAL
jgi:argininosuccinate lyase